MKLKKLLFTAFALVLLFEAKTQIKIGDNPTTINANSLLEMESSSKGFLCPRMALNDANSISPMTGSVTEGMMVYNETGSLEKGFYYWNGSKWIRMATDVKTRTNYVLVKSSADFPTPVSGVITLNPGTLYEINGTITLTSKINLNGCTIMGMDHMNDKLVYLPTSGELFTGGSSGTLKMMTLSAPNAGSKLFNLDFAGLQKDFIVQNCIVAGCNNIGSIKGSIGHLLFTDMIFGLNTNGITFQDMLKVHMNNVYWANTNANTYETYLGSFETIRISGGSRNAALTQNATILNISGITSILFGDFKNVLLLGDGSFVQGTFSKQWEVEVNGLKEEKDSESSGNVYLTSSVTNTFSSTDEPVKVNGVTTAVNLFRTSAPESNRLTYTGTKTRYFNAISSLSVVSTAANKNFSFYFAKNGVIMPESKQTLRLASAADKGSITLSCNVELATNDYIEVWVENNSDLTTMTVMSMNVALK